jgi:carboxypeptidase family protein
MNRKKAKIVLAVGVFVGFFAVPGLLLGQQAAATLSGTITGPSGQIVANAKVSAKNTSTGQTAETQSDAAGKYSLPYLAPGDWAVSVQGEGFATKTSNITIISAAAPTLDFLLTVAQAAPSLQDLGFSTNETQANPQLQAMLRKRTEMLKIHQRLGLITTIPMTAALITGPYAKAKGKNGEPIQEPTQANLDAHAALGGLTTALYFTSASYAIFAPRVPGATKHGAIRWHEALAFIHGPGMILTPVLGIMAYNQENAGEKVHGIASAHGTVAYITAASYGAAIVAVSWPIHVKFWEKK